MTTLPLRLLVFALATSWGQSPQNLFEPSPDWTDSVSIRQRYDDANPPSRTDFFVRSKTGSGRPLLIEGKATDDSGSHLSTYEYTWGDDFPSYSNGGAWPAPGRFIHSYAKNGILQNTDTTWWSWDPGQRILISKSSLSRGACRWADSMAFDPQRRLVYQQSCYYDNDGPSPSSYSTVFQAGYERETDSMPRWATEREVLNASTTTQVDSMFSVGPADHPDTLRGTAPAVLVWNAQGKLLARRTLNDSTGGEEYAYDQAGRLVREIRNPRSKTPDTTLFVYSWEPTSVRRTRAERSLSLHLAAKGLLVDLPMPDRIRLYVIGPDGTRRSPSLVRSLPAGRTLLPLSAPPGSLVRVRGSQGESVLSVPAMP